MEAMVVISVESTTEEAVTEKISQLHHPALSAFFSLGLNINIEDRTEPFKIANEILKSRNLTDIFQMPAGISGENFTVEIDIYTTRESAAFYFIDCVADSLAIYLSQALDTRAMIRIDDYSTPLFVYEKGKVIYESLTEHDAFYRGRRWYPRRRPIDKT